MIEVNGTTLKWCTKDFHERSIWCGQKTYRSKSDFAKYMAEKNAAKGGETKYGEKMKASGEFKITLSTMVLSDNFETLKSQFLKD